MTTPGPTPDGVYEQFKLALRGTAEEFEDPVLVFQYENGMADWALNDESVELLQGISKRHIGQVMCHIVALVFGAEARYLDSMQVEVETALDQIESDTESDDEEKVLAVEFIQTSASAQTDGFSHCVALILGWANAAVSADEGETVDWDSIFTLGEEEIG